LRRIPLSHRSHIVGFQSLPSGLVEHDSALERDFVTLTSFVKPSVLITSQPVTIHYWDGPSRRRYTPDFLLTGSGGTPSCRDQVRRGFALIHTPSDGI
jgi:hypothetical protein